MKALAAANRIDADRYEHPFTPTVVNTGKQLVLFDTGNGSLWREYEQLKGRLPPGNLVARMAQAGYQPEDVDVVVITHGHPDHIGGLTKGGEPVFPKARYVFGATDFDFWKKGENVREARKFNRELYVKICLPLADRSTFIKPGDEVVSGIRAVDAFGHSPGLLAFHIESDGKRLLSWADTCGHYVVSIAAAGPASRRRRRKGEGGGHPQAHPRYGGDRGALVAGFHMPFPGFGWVERAGSNYRWVPHSYQLNL